MLSVITPTYNGRKYLEKCAENLFKYTENFEWIVFDDHSTDGTEDFVKNIALYMKPEKKIDNFSKANNIMRGKCSGQYVAFLNNDCYVKKDWAKNALKYLENDQTIGIVGGLLTYPDSDRIQHCGIEFYQGIPRHINHGKSVKKNIFQPCLYQAVTAACAIMPIKIFDLIGMFDEGFIFGYEDVDLCLKLGKFGYKILFDPTCRAEHETSATLRWKGTGHKQNFELLKTKWPNIEAWTHLPYYKTNPA